MTTRRDVRRLSRALDGAVSLARRDLDAFLRMVDLSNPQAVRDELVEVLPLIVRAHGESAAVAAAEWYEEVRGRSVGGSFTARLAAPLPTEQVAGTARWAAGALWSDTPADAIEMLSGATQRFVSYMGRETVARNVSLDPRKPRYARVPSGSDTCAWCLMLASRGFVYHTEATAGDERGTGIGDDFHNDCKCQIVPAWERGRVHIEGYDPDEMYEMYKAAWSAAGGHGATDSDVAFQLRRLFPDAVTDGVTGAD